MVDGLVRDAEPVSAVGGIAEVVAGFQGEIFDLRLVARISDGRDHEHSHRAVRHEIFMEYRLPVFKKLRRSEIYSAPSELFRLPMS